MQIIPIPQLIRMRWSLCQAESNICYPGGKKSEEFLFENLENMHKL